MFLLAVTLMDVSVSVHLLCRSVYWKNALGFDCGSPLGFLFEKICHFYPARGFFAIYVPPYKVLFGLLCVWARFCRYRRTIPKKKVNTRFSSVQVAGKNREIPHCFLLSRGNKSRYRRFLGIFIYHSADILKKISGVTCSLRAEKVLYIVYSRRFSLNVGKIFTFDLLRPGNASCNKKWSNFRFWQLYVSSFINLLARLYVRFRFCTLRKYFSRETNVLFNK